MTCTDYALGKIALEHCNHPEYMTHKGNRRPYGSSPKNKYYGYLGVHHPANITLDLGLDAPVKQISIKFMDPNDKLNRSPNKLQKYAFRLLCSNDMSQWRVLHDTTTTGDPYQVGWVHFKFENNEALGMRYFRIHALHNPANSGFHIVRLRLFDKYPTRVLHQKDTITLPSPLNGVYEYEINDTTPLATKLMNIAERLYRGTRENALGQAEPQGFEEIYNYVVERAFELQAVDGKVDQVRKIITPLISNRMDKKQQESIKSTKWQWITSLFFIVIYIVVSIIGEIQKE